MASRRTAICSDRIRISDNRFDRQRRGEDYPTPAGALGCRISSGWRERYHRALIGQRSPSARPAIRIETSRRPATISATRR